jgi:HAE1 family hydrophobic/amphiphilic exporter-1
MVLAALCAEGETTINDVRYIERGMPVREAAFKGAGEIGFTIMSMTLSLVAVFIPVLFMRGIVGRLLHEFAMTICAAILVSGVVSLTLTPMLCSRYLKVEKQHGRVYVWLERGFQAMENGYRRVLDWTLRHRGKVLGFALLSVTASVAVFMLLKSEFLPEEDESRFLVNIKTPIGASIHYTNQKSREVEAILLRHGEVRNLLTIVGGFSGTQVNQATFVVRLTARHTRTVRQGELLAKVRKELGHVPGIRASAFPIPRVGESRGGKLQFAVIGPNFVAKHADALMQRLGSQSVGNPRRVCLSPRCALCFCSGRCLVAPFQAFVSVFSRGQ